MKNYLLSFLYCLLYLAITLLGFWGLSCILDDQTYQTVIMTSLFLGLGMSFFLSIWFRQDELFFLLFLTLLTYSFLGYFHLSDKPEINAYFNLVAYPLICLLYPINVYLLFQISANDSFSYSFFKKLFILLGEICTIYFFTYFIPFLFGPAVLFMFETKINAFLRFSFGLSSSFPLSSILVFLICLFLIIHRKPNRIEQLQTSLITLFIVTFLSFYFIHFPLFFHLCFVGGVTVVLFSMLQVSHKMAFLDELTNIPGRRALMTRLKELENEDYTLAMIDIDFFKRLNDSYGHEVGDQALRMISATLSQHSAFGTLYRYGGEEFVLLFAHKSLDEVLDSMETTRVLVSNSDFFLRKKAAGSTNKQPYLASIHITLSVGVAQKMSTQSYDEVINIADQALYKAKQTGRNKTVYNRNGRFFELF